MGAGPLTVGCGGGGGGTFPQIIPGLRQTKFSQLSVDVTTTALAPLFSTLLTRSISTNGGAILIMATVALGATALCTPTIRILLDGVPQRAAAGLCGGSGLAESLAIVLLRRGMPAGSHTVVVEWARTTAPAATLACFPVTVPDEHHASLIVQEVQP